MAANTLPVLPSPEFPQALAESQLTTCWFEDEHSDCRQLATVHLLDSDYEYCEAHFQAVQRD